jgi:hypothetical protein
LDSLSFHPEIANRVPHVEVSSNSSDEVMWRAQFDGIISILEWEDNYTKLKKWEIISIKSKICPYESSLKNDFEVFCNIFYTRFQAWALQQWLTYSQEVLDNGIIEMSFISKLSEKHD